MFKFTDPMTQFAAAMEAQGLSKPRTSPLSQDELNARYRQAAAQTSPLSDEELEDVREGLIESARIRREGCF